MKVWLYTDELYPFHGITDNASPYNDCVEVDDKTLRRWKRVVAAFDAVQAEMAAAIEDAPPPPEVQGPPTRLNHMIQETIRNHSKALVDSIVENNALLRRLKGD